MAKRRVHHGGRRRWSRRADEVVRRYRGLTAREVGMEVGRAVREMSDAWLDSQLHGGPRGRDSLFDMCAEMVSDPEALGDQALRWLAALALFHIARNA